MIQWVMGCTARFRFLLLALALALIVAGVVQLRDMPVDFLPEFAPPYIEVQTEAPGLSSLEVEQFITFYLEGLLNGTPWLQSIHSTSIPGLSSIILTFLPETDIVRARQLVSERLSLAYTLPTVAQPPVILQPLSAMSRVMLVGLSSTQISPIQMSVLAHWNIRPALLSIPGVANVAIWGMRDQQLQIEVDPAKLQSHHVRLGQVIATAGNALWVSPLSFLSASTPGSGGWIETPEQRLEIRHILPITSINELGQVNIENTTLKLADVANVLYGYQPLIGDAVLKNGPGLLMLIEKFPGANTLEVARDVEAKLAELQPGLSGIHIDTTIFQPARFIVTALHNISASFLLGAALFVLVLLLLLHSWRGVVISFIAVLFSLLMAILLLSLFNATLNAMLLAGLVMAIVIVVDDAVLSVHNLLQQLRVAKPTRQNFFHAVVEATLAARSAMFYATLILLVALLPLAFLDGILQDFFQPVAFAYVLAVFASLMTALLLTPALSLLFFSQTPQKQGSSPVLRGLQTLHYKTLNFMLTLSKSTPLVVSAIVLGILGLAGLFWLIIAKAPPLLPDFKEPNIIVQWEGVPGTSVTEMVRVMTLASRELQKLPGVSNVAANVGRAVLGPHIVDVNSAELIVNIAPNTDYDQTVAAITRVVDGYPGMFNSVQTYLKERVREVLTGSNSDIVVRIFGTDLDVLRNKAEEVVRAISHIKGVTDLHMEQQTNKPDIAIQVDLDKVQHYGLKPGDVRRAEATWIAGIETGSLFQEQKIFPVEVWGIPATRHSLFSIRDLLLDTSNNQWLPLGDVANVTIMPMPNLIQHDTVSRRIDINLNVSGYTARQVAEQIQQHLHHISFPLEYRTEILGAYQENSNQILQWGTGLAAAVAILLLLQVVFKSFRLAVAVFFTLPAALLGGIIAALVMQNSIPLTALLGLLAVLAIAVRQTVLLMMHYQQLQQQAEESLQDFILRGATAQLAPIVITACAAGFALLPLVIRGIIPGQEIANPLGIIILAGIVSATLFSLLMAPVIYYQIEFHSRRNQHEV